MKKPISIFLAAILSFCFMACGKDNRQEEISPAAAESSVAETETGEALTESGTVPENQTGDNTEDSIEDQTEDNTESEILVAYFTWAENAVLPGEGEVDAVSSPSVTVPGNVQQLAGWVQEETGADLFSIRVTDPYPSDWDACLERANEERGSNVRPALQEKADNLDQYTTVFLGYPNWWYGVPMALLSFLEQNDLSGKDVYLFCSHGTGGLANSVEQITEAAPQAVISDHIFDCYEEEAPSSRENIQAWVQELGLSRQNTITESEEIFMTQIAVSWGENQVIYDMNDSAAARSLLAQLPLTIEVEDYSTNEKIFYPEQELDTVDTPLAQAGTGTLAYYEPWGDVVFFYGDYEENPGLFELGQAVSGGELVSEMTGTVTIEINE